MRFIWNDGFMHGCKKTGTESGRYHDLNNVIGIRALPIENFVSVVEKCGVQLRAVTVADPLTELIRLLLLTDLSNDER